MPPLCIRGRRIVKKLEYRILQIPANANTKYRIPNGQIANTEYQILACITIYEFLKNMYNLIKTSIRYSVFAIRLFGIRYLVFAFVGIRSIRYSSFFTIRRPLNAYEVVTVDPSDGRSEMTPKRLPRSTRLCFPSKG